MDGVAGGGPRPLGIGSVGRSARTRATRGAILQRPLRHGRPRVPGGTRLLLSAPRHLPSREECGRTQLCTRITGEASGPSATQLVGRRVFKPHLAGLGV